MRHSRLRSVAVRGAFAAFIAGAVAMAAHATIAGILEENLRTTAIRAVLERSVAAAGLEDAHAVAERLQRQQTIASPGLLVVSGDDKLSDGGFDVSDLPRGLRVHTQAFGGAPAARQVDGRDGGQLVVGSFLDDADAEIYLTFPRAQVVDDLAQVRSTLVVLVVALAALGALSGALRTPFTREQPVTPPPVADARADEAVPAGAR